MGVARTKGKLGKCEWVIGLLIGFAVGFGIGYAVIPKGGERKANVLSEEEVRRLITEHPGMMHFEVKPGTVKFRSVELVPVEETRSIYWEIKRMNSTTVPDKVWVVEYECEGRGTRIWHPEEYDPPPFSPIVVRVVIDAYTGRELSWISTWMMVGPGSQPPG